MHKTVGRKVGGKKMRGFGEVRAGGRLTVISITIDCAVYRRGAEFLKGTANCGNATDED